MRKIGIVLLAGLLLLQACSPAKKASKNPTQFKMLSYNIHHGNPPSAAKEVISLDSIAAVIEASGADVVAVQELDSNTVRGKNTYQLKVLAEKLKMHYHFERTIPYEGGAYGIGLLSKYPLQKIRSYRLPDTVGTEPRKVLLAVVEINGFPVIVGSTHIDYKNKWVKSLQAAALKEILAPFAREMVIVGGDFNAVPSEESIQLLLTDLTDTGDAKAFTVPVINPSKKIDYIFYRQHKMLKLISSNVLTKYSYASDHLPVLATFQIN